MLGAKAINPKLLFCWTSSVLVSSNRSFRCFAENHVCALADWPGMSIFVAGFAFTPRLAARRRCRCLAQGEDKITECQTCLALTCWWTKAVIDKRAPPSPRQRSELFVAGGNLVA